MLDMTQMKIIKREKFLCVAQFEDKIYRVMIHQKHHEKYGHSFENDEDSFKFETYYQALEANLMYVSNLKRLNQITTNVPRLIDSYFLENEEVHVLVMSLVPGIPLADVNFGSDTLGILCSVMRHLDKLEKEHEIYMKDLHSWNILIDRTYYFIDFEQSLEKDHRQHHNRFQLIFRKLYETYPILVLTLTRGKEWEDGYELIKSWEDMINLVEKIRQILIAYCPSLEVLKTSSFKDPFMAFEFRKTGDLSKAICFGGHNYVLKYYFKNNVLVHNGGKNFKGQDIEILGMKQRVAKYDKESSKLQIGNAPPKAMEFDF